MQNPAHFFTVTPDAFLIACRDDIQTARSLIAALQDPPDAVSGVQILETYDAARQALGDAAARASVTRNAHPDEAMREAASTCEQEIDAVATEISLDHRVYAALSRIALDALDGATKHYVEKTLRELKRSGVDRDAPTRKKVRALREELVRIGQEFGKKIIEDVRAIEVEPHELDGLPADYIAAHAPNAAGKMKITTDTTDYVPFVTYAKSGAARERLWRQYRLRAHPTNLDVLDRLLARRHELATLLGYENWAAYATEDKMIGSAEKVAQFIEDISRASESRAEKDYAQLLARKRIDEPTATRVESWDSGYYAEKVMAEQYGFNAQEIRPYLEYNRVRDGVLALTAKLFGVTYVRVHDAPSWQRDVEVYDVQENGTRVGRIYLDMFPRAGKYKHYAQFTVQNGKAGGASPRLPEGALICNFPQSTDGKPALLELTMVRTFLHEFGHLLHHVLGGHTRWYGLSGVATEWDFVEAPSQMLEEWLWDVESLRSFAVHYETGEPVPAALLQKAKAADEYGKGLWVRTQMFYAATSLEFHRRAPAGPNGKLDTTKLMAELQSRYTPFPYVADTYFHESFGHLDEYSALYYTYMWSLVIAKDLFAKFATSGLQNPSVSLAYRKHVLEPGGSKPAAQLVSDFLGRPYEFGAYKKWLDGGAAR